MEYTGTAERGRDGAVGAICSTCFFRRYFFLNMLTNKR